MRALILALSIFFMQVNAASALRITDNRGGMVIQFTREYERLIQTGETFEIDGLCASACTLVLQAPANRICITERAVFGFHAAYKNDFFAGKVTDREVTEFIIYKYPIAIQEWINRQGGLTSDVLWLKGPELAQMFRLCIGSLTGIY